MDQAVGRIGEAWQGDQLARLFDMRLVDAGEGYARVAATVEDRFLNAHGIGHGAFLFAVVDTAFGMATNSLVDAVGIQWSFSIFRAAKVGQEITGEARVIHRGRRSLVCELTVVSNDGRVLLRGQATALPVPKEQYADPNPDGSGSPSA
jgi:acyl-CoA thioesterase